MTLAVARISQGQIAVVADTMLTEHDKPLPIGQGTIKMCLLPGNLCVAFSESPELAERVFMGFIDRHPEGASYSTVISYFEAASAQTGNEFLLAFGEGPKLAKIADGKFRSSPALTQWIGDKNAYERFREVEARYHEQAQQGRAISAVIFADEPNGSPASELYSTFRSVVLDPTIVTVGGLITVASGRGPAFRFSSYSDILYDWPEGKGEDFDIKYEDRFSLTTSGENIDFSVSQISPHYMNANTVAYYYLKGELLVLFYGHPSGLATRCHVQRGVPVGSIRDTLHQLLPHKLNWLVFVFSAIVMDSVEAPQEGNLAGDGLRLSFICQENGFALDNGPSGILVTSSFSN